MTRAYVPGGSRWCSKCHVRPRRSAQRYCVDCHARWMRANRVPHSEKTPEQRRRANARAYANTYQRRGKLIPQPCDECGAEKAQKHHPDYSKPLDVIWLCRQCHLAHHAEAERRVA